MNYSSESLRNLVMFQNMTILRIDAVLYGFICSAWQDHIFLGKQSSKNFNLKCPRIDGIYNIDIRMSMEDDIRWNEETECREKSQDSELIIEYVIYHVDETLGMPRKEKHILHRNMLDGDNLITERMSFLMDTVMKEFIESIKIFMGHDFLKEMSDKVK